MTKKDEYYWVSIKYDLETDKHLLKIIKGSLPPCALDGYISSARFEKPELLDFMHDLQEMLAEY